MTVAGIIELVDHAIDPNRMTLREAIDFCERLVTELESKIEGMMEDDNGVKKS